MGDAAGFFFYVVGCKELGAGRRNCAAGDLNDDALAVDVAAGADAFDDFLPGVTTL